MKELKAMTHTFTLDAACNFVEGKVGIGMVLQATDKPGRRGAILETIEESYPADGLSKDMEKFAVLRALEIAAQRGYRRVKIRSDYNQMRTQLKNDHKAGLKDGGDDLHRKILRLAQDFEFVQFGFCPGRKNQMAHKLARKAAGIKPKISPELKESHKWEAWEHELWDDEFHGAIFG
ncbi:ribonuclease H family protein [Bdellovibrionota bacterium FG-2]